MVELSAAEQKTSVSLTMEDPEVHALPYPRALKKLKSQSSVSNSDSVSLDYGNNDSRSETELPSTEK